MQREHVNACADACADACATEARGIIVRKEWVDSCTAHKRRVREARFQLGQAIDPDTTEEEIEEDVEPEKPAVESASKRQAMPAAVLPAASAAAAAAPATLLEDLFKGTRVLFFGAMPAERKRHLLRLLVAYDGCVGQRRCAPCAECASVCLCRTEDEYMGDETTHVVSDEPWSAEFDQAAVDNPGVLFVRPSWILVSHERQKREPECNHAIVRPKD
jgi:ferredoxin